MLDVFTNQIIKCRLKMVISSIVARPCKQLSCYAYMASAQTVRYNSNRAAVTRPNRNFYVREFPTVVVQPDGSTIHVRYSIPRQIIQLPLDLRTLSEKERQARLKKREPKQKLVVREEIDDEFDTRQYRKLRRK